MKYYQIVQTEKNYNKDQIVCYYNPKGFDGTISLDKLTPVKKNPFITFYYVRNTYDGERLINYLEDKDKGVIVLLKKDEKEIYVIDDDGYVLGDDFINNLYTCNDKEILKKLNKIGSIIIKENYHTNSLFTRSIRLEDNKMKINGNYTFQVDVFNNCFIETGINGCLTVNYDDVLITTSKYTKVNSNDLDSLLFNILETKEIFNVDNKEELCFRIEEFINMLQEKCGKIINIFMIDEIDILEEVFGILLYGVSLFIETEKKLVVIAAGIYD